MALSVIDMKNAILKAYRGDKWVWKVSRMSDAQIIAVYLSLKKRGKV